jgi:hypothetical protein
MSEEPSESEYSVSEYVRKLLSKVIWSTTKDNGFPYDGRGEKRKLNAQVAVSWCGASTVKV